MKKVSCVLCAVCVLCLCACVGTPRVWDTALAEDEMATVFFYGLTPTAYNGIDITSEDFFYVKIPAGETSIVCDFNWLVGGIVYKGANAAFVFDFEAGKEYTATFGLRDDVAGVKMYDGPRPVIGYPDEDKLVAFTPFLNVRQKNDRLKLR